VTVLVARYKVRDFGAWRPIFDEQQPVRRDHGARRHWVYRTADDWDAVVVASSSPPNSKASRSSTTQGRTRRCSAPASTANPTSSSARWSRQSNTEHGIAAHTDDQRRSRKAPTSTRAAPLTGQLDRVETRQAVADGSPLPPEVRRAYSSRMRAAEPRMLLAVPFGVLIGLVVGTVGGGGAILALPVLVYVFGEGIGPATTASLIVVALAAAAGAGARVHDRQVCWRIALLFAGPAAAGSLLGALGNHAADARVLILTFVPVMLIAAAATWQRATGDPEHDPAGCPPPAPGRATLAGLGVGALTGFFGVGGGFLIVPACRPSAGRAARAARAVSAGGSAGVRAR
jgi:uncharacterized membrane protein YfcA